ncbi:hypothetical protein GALMADRAFT_454604 [Galerina marginata CBS 339.88]|uniref:Uncharacterized protein n=1 Tax=Galerina marginata (strain CBS 339.88) TaxID=685588 RepID=A0A067T386_GALM3|nr:hypothetical protein GALMADRAFT_454604 [Galerina marginata CBS 339.88]
MLVSRYCLDAQRYFSEIPYTTLAFALTTESTILCVFLRSLTLFFFCLILLSSLMFTLKVTYVHIACRDSSYSKWYS